MSNLFSEYATRTDELNAADLAVWKYRTRQGGKKPTQRQRILALFAERSVKVRGRWWVCGGRMLEEKMPRYAARILELKQDGFDIESRKCTHGGTTADYGLSL